MWHWYQVFRNAGMPPALAEECAMIALCYNIRELREWDHPVRIGLATFG